MRRIRLASGEAALVDDEDFPAVGRSHWHAIRSGATTYAGRNIKRGGKKTTITMHREIMFPLPASKQVDHINGDGLDNRRSNLRAVTKSENHANRHRWRRGAAGYRGVTPTASGRFKAYVTKDQVFHYLGRFSTAEAAARARDAKAKELFGNTARLNFPEE